MAIIKNNAVKFVYVESGATKPEWADDTIYFVQDELKIYVNGDPYGATEEDFASFLASVGFDLNFNNQDELIGVSLNNDFHITGDLIVDGETITLNTSELLVDDNIIELNSNLTGTHTAPIMSGIKVNRGSNGDPYVFVLTEENGKALFRVGKLVDESKGPSSGENDLQAVLTRDDTPVDKAVFYWDDNTSKAKTNSKIKIDDNTIKIDGHAVRTVNETIPVNKGGTGKTSYEKGDILYASNSTTLASLAIGNPGEVLKVSAFGVPSWTDEVKYTAENGIDFTAGINGGTFSLKTATTSILGGVRLGAAKIASVITNESTSGKTARYYPVQTNNSDQLVVNVPSDNTTYTAIDGIKIEGTVIKHVNNVTASTGSGSNQMASFGQDFNIPHIKYDEHGHITSVLSKTVTMPTLPGTIVYTDTPQDITGIKTFKAAIQFNNANNYIHNTTKQIWLSEVRQTAPGHQPSGGLAPSGSCSIPGQEWKSVAFGNEYVHYTCTLIEGGLEMVSDNLIMLDAPEGIYLKNKAFLTNYNISDFTEHSLVTKQYVDSQITVWDVKSA